MMKIQYSNNGIIGQRLTLFLLLLASMNFAAKYFYFIFAATLIIILMKKGKIKVDLIFALLLLFSTSLVLLSPAMSSSFKVIVKQYAYPACYLMGINFISNDMKKNEQSTAHQPHYYRLVNSAIYIVATGGFIHFFINYIINIGNANRNAIDVWSQNSMSATGQAILAVMMIGVIAEILFINKKQSLKLIATVVLLIILLFNLILACRSLIAIIFIVFLIAILYNLMGQKRRVKSYLMLLLTVLLIVLLVLAVKNNIFGVTTFLSKSNIFVRFENMSILEDSRSLIRKQYLQYIFIYPFGGDKIENIVGIVAHDLYLDTYNASGIMGFIFLSIIIIVSIIQLLKIVVDKSYYFETRGLLLCVNLSIYLAFLIEPILDGCPWLLCSFFYFQGLIAALRRSSSGIAAECYGKRK